MQKNGGGEGGKKPKSEEGKMKEEEKVRGCG